MKRKIDSTISDTSTPFLGISVSMQYSASNTHIIYKHLDSHSYFDVSISLHYSSEISMPYSEILRHLILHA